MYEVTRTWAGELTHLRIADGDRSTLCGRQRSLGVVAGRRSSDLRDLRPYVTCSHCRKSRRTS